MQINRNFIIAIPILILLAILPFVTDQSDIINLFFIIFLSITLAQSWNILGGYAGQVNLGHAAFFGIGTLIARYLWIAGLPIYAAMLVAGVAAVLFALIIGIPTFRLRGAYFAIGTLGVAETLRITISNVLPIVNALPSNLIVTYDLTSRYHTALALAAITVLAAYWLVNSRTGLGILAVREDESAAEASGVSALRHKLIALTVSSFFAGVAGGLFAFYHVSYYYQFPFAPHWTFDALMITYVGGVGTIIGPIIGGVFYVVVREWLAVSLPDAHLLVFGALFIAVVLVLPGGLVEAWGKLPLSLWARVRSKTLRGEGYPIVR